MRDIRGDLQERAMLIEKEIAAAGDDFDRTVEQLQRELKARIAALGVAMLAEHYRTALSLSLDGEQQGLRLRPAPDCLPDLPTRVANLTSKPLLGS